MKSSAKMYADIEDAVTLRAGDSLTSKAHSLAPVCSYCDARTLRNSHVPRLEDSIVLWQMIFPTLLSLRLLAVNGRLLGLYFRAMICLKQADGPHTDLI